MNDPGLAVLPVPEYSYDIPRFILELVLWAFNTFITYSDEKEFLCYKVMFCVQSLKELYYPASMLNARGENYAQQDPLKFTKQIFLDLSKDFQQALFLWKLFF